MIGSFFWVAVGAAGAIELDRLLDRVWDSLRPANVTSTLLDKANEMLEKEQSSRAR
jgi:hypothetical protein